MRVLDALRRRRGADPEVPPPARVSVCRSHFGPEGGYIQIDSVIVWAVAEPATTRIRPGQVLRVVAFDPETSVATVSAAISAKGRDDR